LSPLLSSPLLSSPLLSSHKALARARVTIGVAMQSREPPHKARQRNAAPERFNQCHTQSGGALRGMPFHKRNAWAIKTFWKLPYYDA